MVKLSKNSPLRHKLAFAAVCVAINAAGYSFAKSFELPFWLDTIGTCMTGCVLGPVYGGITGLASNMVMGITDTVALIYSLINVLIGVIVGFIAKKGICTDIFNVLCVSIAVGFFATICAVPLNCIFYEGYISNKWGDALFDMLAHYSISVPVRSVCGQAFIDIPDKVITFASAFFIVNFLRKSGIYESSGKTRAD